MMHNFTLKNLEISFIIYNFNIRIFNVHNFCGKDKEKSQSSLSYTISTW